MNNACDRFNECYENRPYVGFLENPLSTQTYYLFSRLRTNTFIHSSIAIQIDCSASMQQASIHLKSANKAAQPIRQN